MATGEGMAVALFGHDAPCGANLSLIASAMVGYGAGVAREKLNITNSPTAPSLC